MLSFLDISFVLLEDLLSLSLVFKYKIGPLYITLSGFHSISKREIYDLLPGGRDAVGMAIYQHTACVRKPWGVSFLSTATSAGKRSSSSLSFFRSFLSSLAELLILVWRSLLDR